MATASDGSISANSKESASKRAQTLPGTAEQSKEPAEPKEMVTLQIDGITVEVEKGLSLLEAARNIGINIPSLCYLKDINEIGACRVCLVEIEGQRTLQASCVYPSVDGLIVRTNTARVRKARKRTVELLLSNHHRECTTCNRNLNCELQNVADDLAIRDIEPTGEVRRYEIHDNNPAIQRDYNKCIHCRRCEAICSKMQQCHVYSAQNRGFETVIAPAFMRDLGEVACIMCGQCVIACPVGSLTDKESMSPIWEILEDPRNHVVVQTAPSIQVTLGEEFGLPVGTVVTGKMVTALRRLGFDQVFATDFAADLTIMEEAHEFIGRFEEGRLPFLTSCCPGWIKFCEHFYPQFIPNLSTCKSPMSMFGALTRFYHGKKRDIDPERLFSVAIMPCTAKKYEAARPEHSDGKRPHIDYVLTTRELAMMIRQAGIDFAKLPDSEYDSPLGEYTGAGTIFGATGGVMEAALRTAYWAMTGGKKVENSPQEEVREQTVEFREIRGQSGLKISKVRLGDHEIKVAVAHGTGNARQILEAIIAGEKIDYVEIMACPGGCVGGGGQPVLGGRDHRKISLDYRHNRSDALYNIDYSKKLRNSHENATIQNLYKTYLDHPGSEKAHKVLHTAYRARNRWS
ncbi:2Fe-2S iron-sulfur cluster binding domain-containing protein [Heliorestis acidaminivorans]|uniref:2Fe-2S iron-sulfur cluster binding domain-containing protein n=2 Tax=Heliorestis acidaminivorans TaxID=553427 RepID=A0A6I0F3T8_9FIRM|nr:2Fe-2S iron-sulfur cluster binding domain-containing protein [Heliorestis acidaminivorans]